MFLRTKKPPVSAAFSSFSGSPHSKKSTSWLFMREKYALDGDRVFAPMLSFLEELLFCPVLEDGAFAADAFAQEQRCLLERLQGEEMRSAQFRTAVALIMDGKEYLFEGIVRGEIAHEQHGEGGFGYDPLFFPEGGELTFAQMSSEEKNAISHRGRAVRKLAEFLQKIE